MEVLRKFRSQLWYFLTPAGDVIQITKATIAALYSVGGVRTTFTIGVGAGGPAAYWFVWNNLLCFQDIWP